MYTSTGSTGPASPVLEDGPEHPKQASAWLLLRVWLELGIQSFGGGTATQMLIYRAFVERRRWITPDEFTRSWAMVHLTPGINLLALTVLIGWKLRGVIGVALSLAGLLLPSVSITLLMTAIYSGVRNQPLVQAGLRGVVPATVGLGLLMSWQLARPLLAASRREGRGSLALGTLLLTGSAVASLLGTPVILLIAVAGLIAGFHGWRSTSASGDDA
ncbi:MAG: chromate transporter [Chloroflexota bacterium]|nr:chromate transporter [Chloroflexota bacterium]